MGVWGGGNSREVMSTTTENKGAGSMGELGIITVPGGLELSCFLRAFAILLLPLLLDEST